MEPPLKQGNTGSLFSPSLRLAFFAVFLNTFAFALNVPSFVFLVENFPKEQGIRLAFIITAYSLTQFLFSPIWGRISDKFGRKPIILIGLAGFSASFLIFSLSENYLVVIGSQSLAGFFAAATTPSAKAYIGDNTSLDKRAKWFAALGAAYGLGFSIAPAIGGLLASNSIANLPLQTIPALMASCLCLANFFIVLLKFKDSKPNENSVVRISIKSSFPILILFLTLPSVALLTITSGVMSMLFAGFETILPLYLMKINPNTTIIIVGLFYFYVGIWGIITQGLLSTKIISRVGEKKTIMLALGISMVGYFLPLFNFNNIIMFGLSITPLAIGYSLASPALNSAVSKSVSKSEQGLAMGSLSSAGAMGRIIGPLFLATLFDNSGIIGTLLIAGILTSILLIFITFFISPIIRTAPALTTIHKIA